MNQLADKPISFPSSCQLHCLHGTEEALAKVATSIPRRRASFLADGIHWSHFWGCWSLHQRTYRYNQVRTSFPFPPFSDLTFCRASQRTRIQRATALKGETAWTRFATVAGQMFKEEGPQAFYKGITPRVMRVAPGQAVSRISCFLVSNVGS